MLHSQTVTGYINKFESQQQNKKQQQKNGKKEERKKKEKITRICPFCLYEILVKRKQIRKT